MTYMIMITIKRDTERIYHAIARTWHCKNVFRSTCLCIWFT